MVRAALPLAPPLVVIGLGVSWMIALAASAPDGVFYSGDGGLKTLMARQLLRGDWVPWLSLGEQGWVRALWDEGMYPFRPPFAHPLDGRWYSSFEWAFPTLSAPGYALAGDRGLYALPVLGLVAVWARFVALLRALRVGVMPSTVSLALLIFATPLTFYAATFWEHTPAVALGFAGYADLLLLGHDPRRARALRAGLLLGLACWLRPEAMVFGAVALAAHLLPAHLLPARRRASLLAAASFAGVVGALLVFNRLAYGDALGVHAIQVLERSGDPAARMTEALELARGLRDLWRDAVPFTWAALLVSGAALASAGSLGGASRRAMVVVLLAFAGTAAMVPNNGGRQIGPRYLLMLLPLATLLVALGLEHLRRSPRLRLVAWVVALVLVAAGAGAAHDNLTIRTAGLRASYATRILPSVRAIERRPDAGVVFAHHWAAMEMSSVMGARPVVTIAGRRQLDRAVEAMARHGHEVLLVDGPGRPRFRLRGRQRHGGVEIDWTLVSERGEYQVVRGSAAHSPLDP